MTCFASLPAATGRPSTLLPLPLVLINGSPRVDAELTDMARRGPLDTRSAQITSPRSAIAPTDRISIGLPVNLAGETSVLPLFKGRAVRSEQRAAQPVHESFELEDDWAALLNRPIGQALEARTVGDLILALSQAGALHLGPDGLPSDVFNRVTSFSISPVRTFGSVLTELLDENDLFVFRSMRWSDGSISEIREVRSTDQSPAYEIPNASEASGRSCVSDALIGGEAARPMRIRAVANGAVAESTFDLIGAWPGSEEGRPDADYARSTSSAFDTVANVYRRWALNEDGTFAGARYDATALFDDGPAVPAVPLRFGSALTLDAAGQRLGIVVEYSTDGTNWQRYPGRFTNLSDRAGIYLADDALPSAVLAAAKAQTLGLRVTATVRNPLALEQTRWIGNPFLGPFGEAQRTLGDRFEVRRVADSSKFAASVASGDLLADEIDQQDEMAAWLAALPINAVVSDRSVIQAARVMSAVGIGDRVRFESAVRWHVVREVRHDWQMGASRLMASERWGARR